MTNFLDWFDTAPIGEAMLFLYVFIAVVYLTVSLFLLGFKYLKGKI